MKKPILSDYGLSEDKIAEYEKSLNKYQLAREHQEQINSSYNIMLFFFVAFLMIVYGTMFYILLFNGFNVMLILMIYLTIQVLVTLILIIKEHLHINDAIMQFIYAISIPLFGLGAVLYQIFEHNEKYTDLKIRKNVYINLSVEKKVLAFKQDFMDWETWQNKTALDYWHSISGYEFEKEIAKLYQKLGYTVQTTPLTGDGGVDIILLKNSKRIAVQCKHHAKPVGPAPVRELMGVVASQGFDSGIFISLNGYTQTVYKERDKSFVKIKLLSIVDIINLIKNSTEEIDLLYKHSATIDIKEELSKADKSVL